MTAISAAVQTLKIAFDLTKTAVDAHDVAIIRTKVIELQREIFAAQASALTAQADQFALLDRVRELEKEVADLKAWDTEKQKYQLTNIKEPNAPGGAAFAYTLKPNASSTEPLHSLCARCFQDGIKAVLQSEVRTPGLVHVLFCTRCCAEISVTGVWYQNTPRVKGQRANR